MRDLLVAWVACPALLLALFTGIGLGVARIAGDAIPLAVVPACGLAVVVAGGGALAGFAGELVVPVLVALALVGATVGRRRLRGRGWWAALAVAGAFALYAAPIVLGGEPTFAGYIKLDDTATWLAITDRIMDGSTDTAGLAPSSYEATLAINFENGYPVGGFVPLVVAAELLGTDPAWLFQPYLAVLGALLALALWELGRGMVASPALRALVAATASCSALLVGYYLWGGIKEMLTAGLVAALCASMTPPRTRALLGSGVLVVGLVGAASVGGLVWAAPALGLAGIRAVRGSPRANRAWVVVAAALALALVVAGVVLTGARLSPFRDSFTNQDDLGNLAEPLELAQLAGIWPASDFRFDPGVEGAAWGLIAVVVAAALAGIVGAGRRKDSPLLLYSLGSLATVGVVASFASPWLDAKALAIASPAVLALALAGLADASRRWRTPALAGLALVVAGVAWSAVAQWGGASLAPREQLLELEQLGERLAGRGPALMTEYQPYGVRHFLRAADPEGASELRRRRVPLLDGGVAAKGEWVDTDALEPKGLAPYRALVLRRSPRQSRPPGGWEPTWRGQFYELWERDADAPEAAARLPLGRGSDPGSLPGCAAVRHLATVAEPAGALLAAAAPRTLSAPGAETELRVSGAGAYEAWLGGSHRGSATLLRDGEPLAERRHQLNPGGLYAGLGELELTAGPNALEVELGGADLRPGSAPDGSNPGPLVLREAGPQRLVRADPAHPSRLCGRRWDWIEAYPAAAGSARKPHRP